MEERAEARYRDGRKAETETGRASALEVNWLQRGVSREAEEGKEVESKGWGVHRA